MDTITSENFSPMPIENNRHAFLLLQITVRATLSFEISSNHPEMIFMFISQKSQNIYNGIVV
ncbi:hypothetical protein T4B_13621 [Trichinella pseudospiralis]|uniref:Uncharacterized protein n=2 Tax=Trichinella pseudospiralis TaxID=6337 RepID=A0A0V1IQT3_TRIPS|nr:hypothetical protein T4D_15246 [Trichinella pseudospiralis]KRZ24924.1 hypothetical protein T4B_13621 [Trichinella pseudospiralis]